MDDTIKAYHEAGHAVIHHLIGCKIEYVTIDGDGRTASSGSRTVRDKVKSLIAGHYGENLCPVKDETSSLIAQDALEVRRLLNRMYSKQYGTQPSEDQEQYKAWEHAILTELHDEMFANEAEKVAVANLAKELIKSRTVVGARAHEIIGDALK